MGDDSAYWRWRDEVLMHPDGRAAGGEPCVLCETPIPPNAYWKYKDRHVCSGKCNLNLGKRFLRMKDKKGDGTFLGHAAPPRPLNRPNPRTKPPSTHFGMLDDPFPFDFDGYGPQPGDSITRFASTIAFHLANMQGLISAGLPVMANWQDRQVLFAYHQPTDTGALVVADPFDSTPGRLHLGIVTKVSHETEPLELVPWSSEEHFLGSEGVEYRWMKETIRDVRPDDTTFDWSALICLPTSAEHPGLLWSPRYEELSGRLSRISDNTSRHARRVRIKGGAVERFAALEIFERDKWVCRLCDRPIDQTLKWPEPFSASLDHTMPLSAGGEHTRDNTQAAHL